MNRLMVIMFGIFALGFSENSDNIGSLNVFPADNPWQWDISNYEVHPNSDNFVNNVGISKNLHPDFGTVWNGAPNGIPYRVINGSEAPVKILYTAYGDESDPGPFPIPLDAPIEGGPSGSGDRHVIAVDTANGKLYEIYSAFPQADHWQAQSGAEFDLTINDHHPENWTSADAAGLPIFPGLIRYEEVTLKKSIDHAIRFTVNNSQRKFLFPARHFASSSTDSNLPPMGLRFRLKASFDISAFSKSNQVILTALKKHGMIVADNGGDWFISGSPDDRWDDDDLNNLKTLKGSDFEVVVTVDNNGVPIYPSSVKTGSLYGKPMEQWVVWKRTFYSGFEINLPAKTQVVEVFDFQGRRVMKWAPIENKIFWQERDLFNRVTTAGNYLVNVYGPNFSFSTLIPRIQ